MRNSVIENKSSLSPADVYGILNKLQDQTSRREYMSSEELYVDSSENDEDEDWEFSEYIDS